jgi:hypothetical protein
MIDRISIPGGWYGDAMTSGEHAFIVPHLKQVHTHKGMVPYPEGDQPIWIVITNKPVLRILGQAHFSIRSLEWTDGGSWATLPAACGVWPVIYGLAGETNIAKCAPPTGSQGWRYVRRDGTLVTGDSTIVVRHGLNERTDLSLEQDGSIEGGQANSGAGACAWADGALRLLHPGACFNTRWKWDAVADIVTVSFYDVAADGIEGWVYRMTMADLKALPPVPVLTEPIVAINDKRWCGWFTGTPEEGGGWTTNLDPRSVPGNCYIVIPGGEIKTYDGRRIGWYVEGRPADTNVNDIERMIAAASVAHPGDAIIAYWPRQTTQRPRGANALAVEGYRLLGEPIAFYEARCRARLAEAGAGAWFIPQVFSGNAGLTPELRSIPPVAARIARDTGAHLVMFNGTGRKTGYQEHPEVHADWQAVFAGVTGMPALEEFMEPWKVNITKYDPAIVRGKAFATKVALGNGVEVVFEKDVKDEIHVAVYKDGVQQDRSGMARHVEVTG